MDNRQKVIDAAIKSFSMFGYKGTTMDQIAKIANIGKGTIYLVFSSKDELFTHILDDIANEMHEIAKKSLESEGSFLDKLSHAIRQILLNRSKHEVFSKLSLEVKEIGTKKVISGLEQVEHSIVNFIASEIEKAQSRKDVAPCNATALAFVLFRTYTALVSDWPNPYPHLSDDEVEQVFSDIFVRGLNPSTMS